MDIPCPHCGHAARPSTAEERNRFGAVELVSPSRTLVCSHCGHAFTSAKRTRALDLDIARKLADLGVRGKEAFRYMRRALGYTAADMAELLGVEPETLSRWENGKRDIPSCPMALMASLVLDRSRQRDSMVPRLRAVVSHRESADTPLRVTRV